MKFVFIFMTFCFVTVQAQIVNEESEWEQIQEIREKSVQNFSSFEDAEQEQKLELEERRKQLKLSMEQDLEVASKQASKVTELVGVEVSDRQQEEFIDETDSAENNASDESDSTDFSFNIVILCIIAFLLIIFVFRYVYLHSAHAKSKVRSI